MDGAVTETNLPLRIFKKGKVREVYDLDDRLLVVATDRISAFDVILPNGIPKKGKVLTQLSLYWFDKVKRIVKNHVITADVMDYPQKLKPHREVLDGRSMLVEKAEVIPIECVVRGYLSGSAWKEYQQTNSVCGIGLPKGLVESQMLPKPIFTPATKADTGHDINVSEEKAAEIVGEDVIEKVKKYSLSIYKLARDEAAKKGIIVADTKFEFGLKDGRIILVDEVLTPDSSRFWPADDYQAGRPQKSFDKQYVRDYLEDIGWNKEPPAPKLPDNVVMSTSAKYVEAYGRITGRKLA
ncbi:MAG: phosphoribosylaminoimidazolesuccinocarboxamide synthase [Candidatus Altiarchaeota archaeon]